MFAPRHSFIAVDVGASSASVCQLARRGGRLVARRMRRLAARIGNVPESEPTVCRSRAARLIRQSSLAGRAAALHAPISAVTYHWFTAPAELFQASAAEWKSVLRCEAGRQMGVDPGQLEVAGWPLPKRGGGPAVMLAAMPRSVVEEQRELAADLGLELHRLDLLPLALLRAGWRAGIPGQSHGARSTCLWGVLELGLHTACLAVAIGHHCIFVRNLTIAGDSFTRSLLDVLGIEYGVAETLKEVVGVDTVPEPGEIGLGTAPASTAQSAIRARVRALTAEVRRAITFALEGYPDAAPVGLYLTGGAARMTGLATQMTEALGVTVTPLTPRDILGGAAAEDEFLDDPALSSAVGLALAERDL
jgi:type IV pilus assembly protein PilM